jgi:protein-tyrosine-phosphatase/DNA-binding HxlR family transcriptional regulator
MDLAARARCHAALGEPARLAIVDELMRSDRSPSELLELLDIESNLLAHHLGVLEEAGLVRRVKSSGDGRRRYVQLVRNAMDGLVSNSAIRQRERRALFVCTRNSARSQIAAAAWSHLGIGPAESAGTQPADEIHPQAISAAARAGITIRSTSPRHISELGELPPLVVTVCDQAHEEIDTPSNWLHWSIPDPVAKGTKRAFDEAVKDITSRIHHFDTGAQP